MDGLHGLGLAIDGQDFRQLLFALSPFLRARYVFVSEVAGEAIPWQPREIETHAMVVLHRSPEVVQRIPPDSLHRLERACWHIFNGGLESPLIHLLGYIERFK